MAMQPGSPDSSRSNRVPIPRLEPPHRRPQPPSSQKSTRVRASKACDNCRKRKIKCTVGTPCRYCEEQNLVCVYAQGRRDRLRDATDYNKQLVDLLTDLSLGGTLQDADQKRVDDMLPLVTQDAQSITKPLAPKWSISKSQASSEHSGSGEAHVSGSVGSNNDGDHLDENLLESDEARATGFIGQNSEIQWLHHLRQDSQKDDQVKVPIAESTFYLDGVSLELDYLEPRAMPLPETIQRLLDAYMISIHSAFPILPSRLERIFRDYISASHPEAQFVLAVKEQAILNLIMAIGARFSHLSQAEWAEDDRHHLVYMNRAVKLLEQEPNANIINSAPDFSLIQVTGLLSLYYVVIGHVSRAWVVIGISIRHAFAIGMHLHNDDRSAGSEKQEIIMTVWWSLHSIECLLSAMTGRPCVIANDHCTVQLPGSASTTNSPRERKLSQKSQAPSAPPFESFFVSRVSIGRIIQDTQTLLYSPKVNEQSWEQVQESIVLLFNDLELWRERSFPNGVIECETFLQTGGDPDLFREQYILRFYYLSTRIHISRPCLCPIDERIDNQSTKSMNFNQDKARSCVTAACDLANLFPDNPNAIWIYQFGPWWCLMHNIMQAATIFLVELTQRIAYPDGDGPNATTPLKKLVLWLNAMSGNDDVANKACNIILTVIKACDLSHLFEEDQEMNLVLDREKYHSQQPFDPSLAPVERHLQFTYPPFTNNAWNNPQAGPSIQGSIMVDNHFVDPFLAAASTNPSFTAIPDNTGGKRNWDDFTGFGNVGNGSGQHTQQQSRPFTPHQPLGQFPRQDDPSSFPSSFNQDPPTLWPSNFDITSMPEINQDMEEGWGTTYDPNAFTRYQQDQSGGSGGAQNYQQGTSEEQRRP